MEGVPAPGGIASPRSVSCGAGRVIRQDSSLGQKQLNGARGRGALPDFRTGSAPSPGRPGRLATF